MTNAELIAKADRNEGLTVDEIKKYNKLVKPKEHAYGKYGRLAEQYLEQQGTLWLIQDIPSYLHGVDKAAKRMYDVLEKKLSKLDEYKRTGDYLEDVHRINAMQKAIEEEILNEIVYVDVKVE